MIRITDDIAIGDNEVHEDFVRSSGPGGQNVNKVATAVQLRFDVAHSPSLPEPVRRRLMRLAGQRLTDAGVLVLHAQQFRTQDQNRQDARERLVALIRQAAAKPKRRIRTKPTRASRQRRHEAKRQRGQTKRLRGPVLGEDR